MVGSSQANVHECVWWCPIKFDNRVWKLKFDATHPVPILQVITHIFDVVSVGILYLFLLVVCMKWMWSLKVNYSDCHSRDGIRARCPV